MLSVGAIITRFFPAFSRTRRLRADVCRAGAAISQCGTAALGAHTDRCECGHVERIAYNSCRHRSCPQCRGGRRAEWLSSLNQHLLPCDHAHVIFTVPADLNGWWRFNRVTFAELLMRAARESLRDLLADPRYLGAMPGIISVLHTWGRNLSIHPHVHCLVTAGGLASDGSFVKQKRKSLLPARVLMMVFRGKLRCLLLQALEADQLQLPTGLSVAQARTLLNRLGRSIWNVRIEDTYAHGVSVAGYLAKYVTGGPISNRRLVSIDANSVVFRYHDYRSGTQRQMSLHPHEFLARWFEHVPPHGLRAIRRSGLYANYYAEKRRQIQQLVQPTTAAKIAQDSITPLDQEVCPLCNRRVKRHRISTHHYSAFRHQNTPTLRKINQPP